MNIKRVLLIRGFVKKLLLALILTFVSSGAKVVRGFSIVKPSSLTNPLNAKPQLII